MMNILLFLLPAFCACLILTGIHTYLGMHVIKRGVIFVDIALAQIAALGMTIALLFGYEIGSQPTYFFTLAATCVGALFFAYFRDGKIPQEALIGVSFAVSSALSILISDKIPHGSEHLKYVLSGNILWVTWPQILKTTLIYLGLGAFHFIFRRRFLAVSTEPEKAAKEGVRVWIWNLIFYLTFGIVITSSVEIGGVLLVFAFLIVPACTSLLFFEGLGPVIFGGWVVGFIVSALAMVLSYLYDLPTGPTIVALFGGVLFASFVFKRLVLGKK